MDELVELKKEVAGLRKEIDHFRERWDFFEETWQAVIIEFCKEWHIATPEQLVKRMEPHS